MDMQKFVDALGKAGEQTRSDYHLTLGALIRKLEAIEDKSLPVAYLDGGYPDEANSYRGYYSDLSFDRTNEAVSVEKFLATAKAALGETFTGYKGGEFKMHDKTPLWCAEYGCCGPAIVDLQETPAGIFLVTKMIDD